MIDFLIKLNLVSHRCVTKIHPGCARTSPVSDAKFPAAAMDDVSKYSLIHMDDNDHDSESHSVLNAQTQQRSLAHSVLVFSVQLQFVLYFSN